MFEGVGGFDVFISLRVAKPFAFDAPFLLNLKFRVPHLLRRFQKVRVLTLPFGQLPRFRFFPQTSTASYHCTPRFAMRC
jgi:hypothetical protein